MNLVEQIFMQARAGSAQGEGFGQFFAAGVEAGQKQQQIELAKRRLAMEMAQAEVSSMLQEQESAMQSAKLNEYYENRQAILDNEEAFQGLAGQIGQDLMGDDPTAAEKSYWDAMSKHKGLWRHPGMKPLLEDTRAGLAAKLEQQRLRNQSFEPQLQTLTDPATGKQFPVIRTGPNTAQVIDPEKAELQKEALKLRRERLTKELPQDAKMEAQSLYKQIDRKREQLDDKSAFPDETWSFGFPPKKVPNPKRAALEAEIGGLQEKIKKLTGSDSEASMLAPKAGVPSPVPPASVPPSSDRVIVRDAQGKRFWIPANELERAARQGYTPE